MAKINRKKRIPEAARALFAEWGRIGGSAKTPAKSAAAKERSKKRAAARKTVAA